MTPGQGFAEFYAAYPRHIGKLDAEKAYGQMRRKGIEHERIMAGVERYKEHLPEEMKFVPYPASWLRAGRFDDEYSELPAKPEPQVGKLTAALQRASAGLARQHMRQVK